METAYTEIYLYRMFDGQSMEAPDETLAGDYFSLLRALYQEWQQYGLEQVQRTWNDVLSRQYRELATRLKQNRGRRLNLRTLADLRTLPPIEYLGQGLLVKGGYNVIYGPPNAGKTFWALAIATEVARTERVVYWAGEGDRGLEGRMSALLQHRQIEELDTNITFSSCELNLVEEESVNLFTEELRPHPPALIVIDTLARAMVGGDENSSKDMGFVNRHVDRIREELGSTVLVVHHCGHSGDHERGSNSLRGAVDVLLELKERDRSIELRCIKSKHDARFKERYYRLVTTSLPSGRHEAVIVPIDAAHRFTEVECNVLEYLKNGIGATKGEIQAALQVPTESQTVQKALLRLTSIGHLTHSGRGQPYFITQEGLAALEDTQLAENDNEAA